jgi:hypothetical protein
MTIEEFNKIPLHFAYHISMSEWSELCYVSEDNFFGVQRITDKDEETGVLGKTRVHYRIGDKWYKSKKKFLEALEKL